MALVSVLKGGSRELEMTLAREKNNMIALEGNYKSLLISFQPKAGEATILEGPGRIEVTVEKDLLALVAEGK